MIVTLIALVLLVVALAVIVLNEKQGPRPPDEAPPGQI